MITKAEFLAKWNPVRRAVLEHCEEAYKRNLRKTKQRLMTALQKATENGYLTHVVFEVGRVNQCEDSARLTADLTLELQQAGFYVRRTVESGARFLIIYWTGGDDEA